MPQSYAPAIAVIRNLSIADLSYLAEAGTVVDEDQPGAAYLMRVRDNVVERVESAVAAADVDVDPADNPSDVDLLEAMYQSHAWLDAAADALPPRDDRRHHWQAFLDLEAYEWVTNDGTLETAQADAVRPLGDVVDDALLAIGRHLAESLESKMRDVLYPE